MEKILFLLPLCVAFLDHARAEVPKNGDPHGKSQFLSTAATAWATAGLAQLLPPKPAAPDR